MKTKRARIDWRKAHRDRMADLRWTRRALKQCRQCKNPAKLDKNGEPMAMCEDHLAEDKARVSRAYNKAKKAKRR